MLLFTFVSCHDSGSSSSKDQQVDSTAINQNEEIRPDGTNVQGDYAAEIWPVNYNLQFKSIGHVGVKREGDEFKVMVNLKYGPKDRVIKQAFYNSRRCPTIKDDLNKDAYIDIMEAKLAIGKIVIPFDSNLDSQLKGQNDYPRTDASGKMNYSMSASFERMFSDLKEVDENPSDEIIKLYENDGITLPGRIVLFQGMPRNAFLPETVASTPDEDKYDSIPVGCAVLWKVDQMPEELR